MNTFLKIALGFVLGVSTCLGVLYVKSINDTNNNQEITDEEELRDEIRFHALKNLRDAMKNDNYNENGERINESFELTTQKGVVKLHTNMPKDSVKILMGRPKSTSIDDSGYNGMVTETWKYKGTNTVFDEFTILFINGKLKSVSQYKE